MGTMGRLTLQRFLADIPDLNVQVVDDAEHKTLFSRARDTFFPSVVASTAHADLSDASTNEVRNLLKNWGVADAEVCYVIWLSEAAGIRISGPEFVHRYDDLWLPGRDDLWVVTSDFTRLVLLTHEEEASLYGARTNQRNA